MNDVIPTCTAGLCCKYLKGKYVNIAGISDLNKVYHWYLIHLKMINYFLKGLNTKNSEINRDLQNLKINDFSVYEIMNEISPPTSFMRYTHPN